MIIFVCRMNVGYIWRLRCRDVTSTQDTTHIKLRLIKHTIHSHWICRLCFFIFLLLLLAPTENRNNFFIILYHRRSTIACVRLELGTAFPFCSGFWKIELNVFIHTATAKQVIVPLHKQKLFWQLSFETRTHKLPKPNILWLPKRTRKKKRIFFFSQRKLFGVVVHKNRKINI